MSFAARLAHLALCTVVLSLYGCVARIPPCPLTSFETGPCPPGAEGRVTLEGRVLDEKGEPVIGATLGLWESPPTQSRPWASRGPSLVLPKGLLAGAASDVNGQFRFPPLSPRPECWITVEACGFYKVGPLELKVDAPGSIELRIPLCASGEDIVCGRSVPMIDYRSTSD